MAMKRHMSGGGTRWALLACVLFLLGGPAMAPLATTYAAPVRDAGGAVLSAQTGIAVTTTADTVDGDTASFDTLLGQPGPDGAISLREALLAASAPAAAGPLAIEFRIPAGDPGYSSASGAWTIALGARALPTLARGNLTIDGATQPGAAEHPRIVIDGMNVYENPGLSNGFTITSARNTIRGLTLMNFYDDAILIDGAGAAFNSILGCYLGTGPTGGRAASSSYFGAEIRNGAHDNLIGGAGAGARNLIGGAEHSGVLISGAGTQGNTVANNWIGLDASGQAGLPNKVAGVMISAGAHSNLIGGANQGNVIAGNDVGIYLDGAIGNTLAGNTVGLAADRKTPLGNASGGVFAVRGAQNNRIGGTLAGLRNVISGNGAVASAFGQGIYLSDANTSGNQIVGNYIGTDGSGTAPAGNYRQGILVAAGAQNNLIGDSAAGAGNVIAYNGLGGIRIDSPNNVVAGNLVGVGADARARLGNQANGIRVGGNNNTIGPNNIISNNQHSGLLLLGSYTTVLANTLADNGRSGVCVAGANTTLDRNQISGNGSAAGPWPECGLRGGIVISDTDSALVTNNIVFGNADAGVTVFRGRSNRILSNSISENPTVGIRLLSGGNENVAPPRLSSVTSTSVRGASCPGCRVELFTDTRNQGRDFVGSTIAGGDGSFQLAIDPNAIQGPHLTATQTDTRGNTSPFAAAVNAPLPAPLPTRPPGAYRPLFLPIVKR